MGVRKEAEDYTFFRLLRQHWMFILTLLFVLWLVYYSYDSQGFIYQAVNVDTEVVTGFLDSFGVLAAVMFVVAIILEVVVAPVPPLVLYVAGGFLFGPFLGGTLALVGNVIGAMIAFEIARRFGRSWVEQKIKSKRRKQFDALAEKYGAFAIFILRVNPFTNSDIFSYLAGLTKMRFSHFLIATALGLAPYVYVQTYIGGDIIRDNPFLTLLFIWAGIAYIAVFFYALWQVHRKSKGQ